MTQTCPACSAAIDTSEAEPLTLIGCPSCGQETRVQRTFDHFEVVETLGAGGMGTVYKARDTRLDRFVALKLLRRDLSSEKDHASRFQREARIAGSVDHPNVIRIFSSGTDHGQFYVVMELVDRGSLDDLIEERKRLPEEQVLESGIQVAKGLRAAHRQGLIHRDVKPANILFIDEETMKISDFGLASAAAERAKRDEIWGTPYYVAPERLNNGPEDFRTDIYGLGAALFLARKPRAHVATSALPSASVASVKLNAKDKSPPRRAVNPQPANATRAENEKKVLGLETAPWNAALANYREQIALYDFAAAREAIKDVQLSDASLKQAQETTEKRAQWLIDWKNNLIGDIK